MDEAPTRRVTGIALAAASTLMLLGSLVLGAGEGSLAVAARFGALAAGILLAALAVVRAWARPLPPTRQSRARRPSRTAAVARTSSSL